MTTKPQSTTEPRADDDPHRWEVEPHPWSTDFDYFITDSDADALTAIQHAAEMYLWDGNEGGERVLRVRLNKDIPETPSNASASSASAAPVVDKDALGSAVVNLLNAFHGSGHGGVDYMVSARLRGCEKCSALAAMLDRALAISPAAATAAPVEEKSFKNTKEAMLYAQQNNIPTVIPVNVPAPQRCSHCDPSFVPTGTDSLCSCHYHSKDLEDIF